MWNRQGNTNTQIMVKEREYWIDAIRTFACLCVIMTHAPIPSTGGGRIAVPIYNFIAIGGASILFFMVSGALILYKQQEFVPFMKKRLSRIVLPMVIWTIISLFVAYMEGKIRLEEIWDKVIMIPFIPQVGTYWFIYVIFGIYLLTPIISTWLTNTRKREVEYALCVWGLTLLLPFLENTPFNHMISYTGGYLYYFYGYLWFAILGFYLRKYINIKKHKSRWMIVPVGTIAIVFAIYPTNIIPHDILQNRMAIHVVLMAVCYFLIIKHLHLPQKIKLFVYTFAQHSFGIYLIHILVMRSILWPLLEPLQINHIIAIPLITLLTASISFLIVWAIGKIVPYSKYIVGV